jgi:hypothetical protein
MRESELSILRREYAETDLQSLDDRFADALGLGLRNLRALRDEIEKDQSETEHGIYWWTNLPLRERVLIGDYLANCVHSIETNLVEAQLHYWEYLDRTAKFDELINRSPPPPNRFRPPPRLAPIDDIHERLIDLHIAGTLRALASVLDCLAAVIIGVLPLKLAILKASFARDLSNLEPQIAQFPRDSGQAQVMRHFQSTFQSTIEKAGPSHWHDWILGYRNMLVHRGRRIGTNVPRAVAPRRWHAEQVLPSEPELSQVEAWARWGNKLDSGQGSFVFTETAQDTLQRAQGAVARLTSGTCECLLDIWRQRRANPSLLPQPAQQWPRIPYAQPSGFAGFHAQSFPFDPETLMGNPDMLRRIRVAALDVESSHVWTDATESDAEEHSV